MKKIIILSFILLTFSNVYSQISRISFPLDQSVFQRDGNLSGSTANIVFTGYIEESSFSSTDSEYWVTRLDKSGSSLGNYISPTTINPGLTARVGVSNVHVYRIVRDIPTGWYSFNLKNGKDNSVTTIKFGVGEVFVIAGQSNAQGYGSAAYNSSTVTNNYECVLSLKNNLMYWNSGQEFYSLDVSIENIPVPVHGQLNSGDPKIGPMGGRPWFYQKLGELIANMHGDSPIVPVVFYNTALGGSTITNWYGAMKTAEKLFSSNYSNPLDPTSTLGYPNASYPNSTGWYVGNFGSNGYERLFLNLKNVLSFYGNMFGVRAVLWHQGESETKTLLTQTSGGVYDAEGTVPSGYNIGTYGSKLLEIIDETREILPGLGWAISKVSLTSELRLSDNTQLYNITNPTGQLISNPAITGNALGAISVGGSVLSEQASLQSGYSSKVGWFTQNSDSYAHSTSSSKRQNNDYVHFSVTGLNDMAGDAYSNTGSYLALSPVLNTPPPIASITRISAGYYNIDMLPSLGGLSYVHKQWSSSYYYEDYVQTASNNNSSTNGSYLRGGFTKDNLGRIHLMPRIDYGLPLARVAANNLSKVYPNPVEAGSVVDFYVEDEGELIKFEYFTENGNILATKTLAGLKIGRHTELIPIEKMKDEKIVYLHISKAKQEKKEAIRLKIN